MKLFGKWRIVNLGRFAVTVAVVVLVFGLYSTIGTIEYRHDRQMEQRVWMQ
jgi:hypothetical protein